MSVESGHVGLGEVPPMESSEKFSIGLNLKATELRLGLPGSESPEREAPLGMVKSLVCAGAKRGFSDAIDGGSGKWVMSGNGGSELGLGKDGGLFSPRGVGNGGGAAKALPASDCTNKQTPLGVKESLPQSSKPLHDKKPQISASAAKYYLLPLASSLFLSVCFLLLFFFFLLKKKKRKKKKKKKK